MGKSLIEWTDRVWNPTTGCSPGLQCYERCYARRFATRLAGRYGYPQDDPFRVTFHPDRLELPLRWRPCRVFVDSMGDLFHEDVSTDVLDRVFAVMAHAPRLTFQILTKRPENAMGYLNNTATLWRIFRECSGVNPWNWPLRNVWLGVSVENQEAADIRIPPLLETQAALRFVSCEALLGPVDLIRYLTFEGEHERAEDMLARYGASQPVSWIIAGGETGPGARPCHPDWLRRLRDQCMAAGVPYWMKGHGEWRKGDQGWAMEKGLKHVHLGVRGFVLDFRVAVEPSATMVRVGRKAAGDLLDGRQWKEMPQHG